MSGAGGPTPDAIEAFTGATGASEDVARRYLQMAKGEVDAAVNLWLEHGDEVPPDLLREAPAAASPPAAAVASEPVAAGKGKGKGRKHIEILMFKDGFCVRDVGEGEGLKAIEKMGEELDDEPPEEAPPQPAPRRTGMMTLNDIKPQGKGKGGMDLLGGKGKGKMQMMKKITENLKDLPPLRSYDDPANKAMGDELKSGKVPKDLQRPGEDVQFVVVPMGDMNYEDAKGLEKMFGAMSLGAGGEAPGKGAPAAASSSLFAGAGQTLGGGSSSAASAAPSAGATPAAGGQGCDPSLLALVQGHAAPAADDAKPATTLQLRLSSGSRVKARLNLDHTVADVWRLVAQQMGEAAFAAASGHELTAGFPPKPLTDPSVTLQAADLANAAVTHRCR